MDPALSPLEANLNAGGCGYRACVSLHDARNVHLLLLRDCKSRSETACRNSATIRMYVMSLMPCKAPNIFFCASRELRIGNDICGALCKVPQIPLRRIKENSWRRCPSCFLAAGHVSAIHFYALLLGRGAQSVLPSRYEAIHGGAIFGAPCKAPKLFVGS